MEIIIDYPHAEDLAVEVGGDTTVGDVREIVEELFMLEERPPLYLGDLELEDDEENLQDLDVVFGSRIRAAVPVRVAAQQELQQLNIEEEHYLDVLSGTDSTWTFTTFEHHSLHDIRTLVLQAGKLRPDQVFAHVFDKDLLQAYLHSGHDLGDSPLVTAMDVGNAVACRMLVAGGVDVNTPTVITETVPLAKAVMEDMPEVCRMLIAAGARVDARGCPLGPALYVAAHINTFRCCQVLVEEGATINKTGAGGDTPLMRAAFSRSIAICELLIDNGASVNKTNSAGDTPLIYAAMEGCVDICRLLLAHGADVNKASFRGTPLRFATKDTGDSLLVLHMLLGKGCSVNKIGMHGLTPVSAAVKEGNRKACEALLDRGADIDKGDVRGVNPLLCAVGLGNADLVRFLLSRGSAVNHTDTQGRAALHHVCLLAAGERYLSPRLDSLCSIAEMLLSSGACVTAADSSGNTPLHFAVGSFVSLALAKLLLKHGADVQRQNEDGDTPLALANEQRGRSDTKKLLEEAIRLPPAGRTAEAPSPRRAAVAPTQVQAAQPAARTPAPHAAAPFFLRLTKKTKPPESDGPSVARPLEPLEQPAAAYTGAAQWQHSHACPAVAAPAAPRSGRGARGRGGGRGRGRGRQGRSA